MYKKIFKIMVRLGFTGLLFIPVIFFVIENTPWIESLHVQERKTWDQEHKTYSRLELRSTQIIGQTFFAQENNLAKIRLFIEPAPATIRGKFYLTILDESTFIREGDFIVKRGESWLILQFSPILDSKGSSYYFYLEPALENKANVTLLRDSRGIEGGELYLSDQEQSGGLFFQTDYSHPTSFTEFCGILFERMSQFKPSWVKTPYLYIYWGAFWVCLVWFVDFAFRFLWDMS